MVKRSWCNNGVRRVVSASQLVPMLLALQLAACAGSNPYGHGREYIMADGEDAYAEKAMDVSYEDVRRNPQAFASQMIGWFGIVSAVDKRSGDTVQIALDMRFHQPRHLCTDQFESSCLVTISERTGGPFTTTLTLRPEDRRGETMLNVGSLVKIYGSPTGDFDERGGPVMRTDWYRHWPHGAFVSTGGSITRRQ